jgi:hypothetical protein
MTRLPDLRARSLLRTQHMLTRLDALSRIMSGIAEIRSNQ